MRTTPSSGSVLVTVMSSTMRLQLEGVLFYHSLSSQTSWSPAILSSIHLKHNPYHSPRRLIPPHFQLDDQVYVSPATEVRNLGVFMDSKLNFHSHVSEMRRNCFHQRKRMNSIRRFLPRDQFAILIHPYITSRIDFCNSIFYSTPENLVSRVQTIQNSCAKLVKFF